MASITSSGAISGLNIDQLVSQLVAADRASEDKRIQRVAGAITTELSAVSKLKAAMSSFQSALGVLKDASAFQQRSVTLSDSDHFSATASVSASAGSYAIEVTQLAKAAQLASAPIVGGATANVGTGTMQISLGSASFSISLASDKQSLADLRDAINNASGNPGVRATLITGTDGTRLVISGSKTGAADAVTITSSGGDGGLAQFNYDPVNGDVPMTVKATAQDAIVQIAGFEARSSTNVVDGAIEGVTLSLKKDDLGKTTTLNITNDDGAVQTKVQNFVSAYNVLANQITSLRSYDASSKSAGPLLGDAMLLGIESQLRRIIAAPVEGLAGNYTALANLGITTSANGSLNLDTAKLNKALQADPAAASKVFATASTGVAVRLNAFLDNHLKTDGDVALREAGITKRQKDLEKQKTNLDSRMQAVQARYLKQFRALDSLLSQMQTTSSYLAKQLGSLNTNQGQGS